MECAVRDKGELPRVLRVGESILNGYQNGTSYGLRGIAYVDAWVNLSDLFPAPPATVAAGCEPPFSAGGPG